MTYCFNRLPFGITIASEVFQKFNTEIFGNIENVFIYIDDILVFAETPEKHDHVLLQVLKKAQQNNIKFNKTKFQFKVQCVKYLGRIFCNGTIKPDNEQIEAILSYMSKNKNDLQRFLGLVNYLRDYIPNCSKISSPLRELLKKNVEFIWLENIHSKCVNEFFFFF